ncbi:MAG: hypothetical protein FWC28_00205 [Proteobacteria bacterium]|nr:hypothetical protein [Pseudomonadota bacterium]
MDVRLNVCKLDFTQKPGDNRRAMGELMDLTLLWEARRLLKAQLEAGGLDFFLSRGGRQWFQIAPERIEEVLVRAQHKLAAAPSVKVVDLARREVRRELIRQVACVMVQTGF